ncbi:hypothetical protein FBR04_19925 [Betaproteobacteria bacterium PRO7]|jgi:hypothetical protein|nr:hypothetical protein [Betaproteobacteria bacterium PRO7]
MILRHRFDAGSQFPAYFTTEHAASSYGQPVLVNADTGEAIDQFSASSLVVVEATDEERVRCAHYGVGVP